MATTFKVLGQQAPSATTETDLYAVPASKYAVTSTLRVTNRGGVTATFRVSVSVAGAATANKDYQFYDLPIPANDSFSLTEGWTLAATDKVRIYASNANLSFTLYGKETDV
jgi:hypothetical protein